MVYHILNGDALKEKFPSDLEGELIIMREALISGPVSDPSFLENRSKYFKEVLGVPKLEYKEKGILELQKLTEIAPKSIVHFWFEDDLFCQANFWYCAHQILKTSKAEKCYLVRPNHDNWTGFGYMNSNDLLESFNTKQIISKDQMHSISKLWKAYQKDDFESMDIFSSELTNLIERLPEVIKAHKDRKPSDNYPGRPKFLLSQIIEELGTKEFGAVFRIFKERAGIYGFGDTQVRKLLDELLDQNSQHQS